MLPRCRLSTPDCGQVLEWLGEGISGLEVSRRLEVGHSVIQRLHFDSTLPSYLSAFLCTYQTSCTLWTLNEKLLKIPKCSLRSVGDRSFSFIASTVWNSLPASLRNLPTLSWLQSPVQNFPFSTGISTDLDGPSCVCVCVCVCVCMFDGVNDVYICVCMCVNGVC